MSHELVIVIQLWAKAISGCNEDDKASAGKPVLEQRNASKTLFIQGDRNSSGLTSQHYSSPPYPDGQYCDPCLHAGIHTRQGIIRIRAVVQYTESSKAAKRNHDVQLACMALKLAINMGSTSAVDNGPSW